MADPCNIYENNKWARGMEFIIGCSHRYLMNECSVYVLFRLLNELQTNERSMQSDCQLQGWALSQNRLAGISTLKLSYFYMCLDRSSHFFLYNKALYGSPFISRTKFVTREYDTTGGILYVKCATHQHVKCHSSGYVKLHLMLASCGETRERQLREQKQQQTQLDYSQHLSAREQSRDCFVNHSIVRSPAFRPIR